VLDLDALRGFFSLLRARFEQERDTLNALDAEVGDGDHGYTVSRAFTAAELAVQASCADVGTLFDTASETLAVAAGGAIGPLLAAFFAEGGVLLRGKQQLNSADLAAFFAGGLEAVQQIGGAQPGQKTLVDALAPAAQALAEHSQEPPASALAVAATAARQGAELTRGMVAMHGRARFLGERSASYQDAGATSLAILVETLHDVAVGTAIPPLPAGQAEHLPPPPAKFINQPANLIAEELEGMALAYPALLHYVPPDILVRAQPKAAGKVALAIGHGGGHTPSMGGFVGPGLLDADAYGPIFTCAPGVRIAEAIRRANRGAGVVLLISNHTGDVLNARLALRRASQEGIAVEGVLLGDDIATAPRSRLEERRGLGGLLFSLKIGGAAAEQGLSLADVAALMRAANERTATLMVAARPPTHPVSGQPMFEMPPGQIEVGAGVHGEAGVYRGAHLHADALIDMLIQRLLEDLNPLLEKRVLSFLNGAGGTSLMELHILNRRVHHALRAHGLEVAGSVVGSFFTTQEMAGFSLSLYALDSASQPLWDWPAQGPYFRWPVG
jgi:dihydroxyacetone kinase phosphoprotein-dependent L subunit